MKNVLIVDDEIAVLSLLKHSLIKYRSEFKVLTAKNGNEAKSILSKKPVSLLVTDIIMPDITGFELLEYVKKKYPATLCYVMTAYNTTEIKKRSHIMLLNFLKNLFQSANLVLKY
ncbi:MAG: response regulator [Desulfobacterales bacterium]|nr:response regulator [Desulfobacteraceae bacterium]MBT7084717.1 response regulator [Desulfobacterales bacterium]